MATYRFKEGDRVRFARCICGQVGRSCTERDYETWGLCSARGSGCTLGDVLVIRKRTIDALMDDITGKEIIQKAYYVRGREWYFCDYELDPVVLDDQDLEEMKPDPFFRSSGGVSDNG